MKKFFNAVKRSNKKAVAVLGTVFAIIVAIIVAVFQAWKNKQVEKANFQHALNEGKEFVELCNTIIDQLPAEQGKLKNDLKEVRDMTYRYVASRYPAEPYHIDQVVRWSIKLKAHQNDPARLYGIINEILMTV